MNLLRFTIVCVGIFIALPIAAALLNSFLGIDISSSAFGVIPPMIAALVEGQYMARTQERLPEMNEKLRLTVFGTLLVIALNTLVMALATQFFPGFAAAVGTGIGAGIAIGMFAFFAAVSAASIFFFFGFGAKNELKAMARRAER